MASHYWIKLYHEILDDPKMGRLRDNLWRRVIECFLLAGEMQADGYLPPLADMAWRLHLNEEMLEAELSELAKVGILEQRDGGWFVVNFADRQSAMTAAERAKRWRERQQKQDYYEEETDPEPPPNENRTNRSQKKKRKEKDTDTDARANGANDDVIGGYELPPEREPRNEKQERLERTRAAISCVVKSPFMPGFNDNDYNPVAEWFIENEVDPEKIEGFREWWVKHGNYKGKPALKSLVHEWNNYHGGMIGAAPDPKDNGHPDNWISEDGVL